MGHQHQTGRRIPWAALVAALGCAVVGPTVWADGTNDWENLAVNSRNRLPARTYSMPLADVQSALTDRLEPETPYKKSLNGQWKISWAGNPDLRVKDFYRIDFDDSDWSVIDVPSCVEMRGFGSPGYTNVRYPHANAAPKILDRQSHKPDYNPVSSYRTTFTVPANWKGREVILRFDGVYSAYYVWVNGEKVGYAEDSKLPSEFDITKYLKDGENLLAVEVYRWCDGSYLEDQDMFRYSGIFRDVTLWAKPKDGIWDFVVRTVLSADYKSATVAVSGCAFDSAVLYDAEGREVLQIAAPDRPLDVPNVNLWSAEKPYLYTLVLKKGDDIRMKRVGFKEQKIVGNAVCVNGRKIKFKGVNRHEADPDNGRTVSLETMMKDIFLMKKFNINTVRTSHYPNHHLWYDLCDKYGIYLIAEANVEGHEPFYGVNGIGRKPEWEDTIVERNLRQVTFYRNNPSVTIWSMGNETGHGICFKSALDQVKALDPTRLTHWERGNRDADIDSQMYPTVEWVINRGKLGDEPFDSRTEMPSWTGGSGKEIAHTAGKPAILCEYAHAMGNAIGNFEEYWDAIYSYDSLMGGCIWDWVDQAIWKYTDRADPKTGKRERYLAYGGDFDEQPNDGPFCVNGVVDPFRNVSAKLVEVGHVYRNLVITKQIGLGPYELENRFGFTFADEFTGDYELVLDGKVVETGSFEVPHIAPLSRGWVKIPFKYAVVPNFEYFLNINFRQKTDTPWVKKGWAVARNQIRLTDAPKTAFASSAPTAAEGIEIAESAKAVTVTAGATKAVFCRKAGALVSLEMNGRAILMETPKGADGLVAGPQLTCARAFVDNDNWLRDNFYASGLTQLRYHARPIVVSNRTVITSIRVTGSKSAGFDHVTEWSFGADGVVAALNRVKPFGTMPQALPRLGLSLKLSGDLENIEYYGRGPGENYVDRQSASFVGRWKSTVRDLGEFYVRPQDNGYRSDVRWAAFTDDAGKGVKFAASKPLFLQALHYGWEDLEFARHRNGQQRFRAPLVEREELCVNLDIRQLGLGGASCGPAPMAKYRFPIADEEWTVYLTPIK